MENKTTNSYPETGICCLCGGVYDHYGNSPWPLVEDDTARCCDRCNQEKIIPARSDEGTVNSLRYEVTDEFLAWFEPKAEDWECSERERFELDLAEQREEWMLEEWEKWNGRQ